MLTAQIETAISSDDWGCLAGCAGISKGSDGGSGSEGCSKGSDEDVTEA